VNGGREEAGGQTGGEGHYSQDVKKKKERK